MANVPNGNPNVLSASGAINGPGSYAITKVGVAALTIAVPVVDGQIVRVWDEDGHAHTITGVINKLTTITFNGTAGSSVELISRNGAWWTFAAFGVTVS